VDLATICAHNNTVPISRALFKKEKEKALTSCTLTMVVKALWLKVDHKSITKVTDSTKKEGETIEFSGETYVLHGDEASEGSESYETDDTSEKSERSVEKNYGKIY